MNQTSEWICKMSLLEHFTRVEHLDLSVLMAELDMIEYDKGAEYGALQSDLQDLVGCYL